MLKLTTNPTIVDFKFQIGIYFIFIFNKYLGFHYHGYPEREKILSQTRVYFFFYVHLFPSFEVLFSRPDKIRSQLISFHVQKV